MSARLLCLLVLFFCSGACGLTYQILWLRQLSLVFGVTVYAASTVLAAFMTGLAIGSLFASRLLVRLARPLAAFGLAEICIGLSALATPFLLEAGTALYVPLSRAVPDSFGVLTVARFLVSFGVLLVPTALMGLTLPLLSASVLVRGTGLGSRVSALYAVNTSGAVAGALVTGFHLIGAVGMHRTFLIAAALNVATGLGALLLSASMDESRRPISPPAAPLPAATSSAESPAPTVWNPRVYPWLLTAVLLSGFASLALEIVWFRTLVQFLTVTTYAFTLMLAMVLGGIACGGFLATRVLARRRDWLSWFTISTLATGVAAVATMVFLGGSYQAGWRTSSPIQACAAAMLPPAILMGLTFPIALRLAATHAGSLNEPGLVSRTIGRLYALNVTGAIAGSLAGGFIVVPWWGTRLGLILLAALYLAMGLALLSVYPDRRRLAPRAAGWVAVFLLCAFWVPDAVTLTANRRHGDGYRELWRDEGAQTAVTVMTDGERRVLFLDGIHQSDDTAGMVRLHRVIGHLPMALHPAPRRALAVGLGGGTTAGAVSQHPNVLVDVVELSESVRRGAPWFSHVNYGVTTRPNVRLRVDDGRNFLLLTDDRFDVITADIIQPTLAGAGSLYSREYFSLVRRALADRGLAMQWIDRRTDVQYRLIMRTFLDVFPNATLWLDGALLVGSVEPLRISRTAFESRLADPAVREALAAIGLDGYDTLRNWYTAGPAEMRRFVGAGPVLTDDRPLVEYHRSLPGADAPGGDETIPRGDVSAIELESDPPR